ncbi:hypothetical protein NPX13_g915 [Xylaria arbuscula]|uniref:Uncharacterized protein n=1 Tax=Xylaria arbuscula TaxID=114810 RepID=A0A9W8TS76_9PEZI|nr:hypothetical protein NPX13_g915 [Xylaria arbuscula]
MPGYIRSSEWNPGNPLPRGAGLPLRPESDDPIKPVNVFGAGTLNDPCILYRCIPIFFGTELDQFNDFARWLCKKLGFTHIWIRAHVHNWTIVRDDITGAKTGDRQDGEDDHITIYLGNSANWIHVHGDVYVKVSVVGKKEHMPEDLRPVEELQLQDGKPPRNLRLFAWTPNLTTVTSSRRDEAMASQNWRAK